MARRTIIRASGVKEDTLEDKDSDTKIQVEKNPDEDKIRFDISGSEIARIESTGMFLTGALSITPGHNEGLTFYKDENELNFVRFANANDGSSYNAYLAYQVAEHLYISPGRGADFYVQSRTNVGSDPFTFPFRIMDDGTAKFEKRQSDSSISTGDIADDVAFYVSGSTDGSHTALFGGKVVTSSSLDVGGQVSINTADPTITFMEGSTLKATIGVNSADNILFENKTMNKHIVFKVNDQGVVKEGFRLDGAVPEVVVNQTSDSLVDFRVESDNQTHMLFVDGSEDKVGIGTSAPQSMLHIESESTHGGTVTISQHDDSTDASQLDLTKSRGTTSAPTTIQSGDFVGQVKFSGYDGDSHDPFADIYVQAAGTISTTSHPSKLVIRTTKESDASLSTALTIDESQSVTVAGNIYGRMMHTTHHRYNDGSGTGLEYIPWAGTSEQNSPSWITQGVAPFAGKLSKVLVRSSKSGGLGSVVVGIHTNTDGNSVIDSTPEETTTLNMSSANTSYIFSFASATHFGPGDIIGVSIDPTNAHGNVNVTCIWEYDVTS